MGARQEVPQEMKNKQKNKKHAHMYMYTLQRQFLEN